MEDDTTRFEVPVQQQSDMNQTQIARRIMGSQNVR